MRSRHDMTILMVSDFLTDSTDFALTLFEKRKQQQEDENKGRGLNIPWSVIISSSAAVAGLLAFLSDDSQESAKDDEAQDKGESAQPEVLDSVPNSEDDGSSLLDRVISWISNIPEVSKQRDQGSAVSSTNYGQTLIGPKSEAPSKFIASDYLMMAAKATGQDPSLIYSVAKIESGLNVGAKNRITNATGLLQIVPSTWKFLIGKYKHLGFTEHDINDPQKNALVGALYLRDISNSLSSALKRAPSSTEVYIGHFLGPSGAIKFLRALQKSPEALASKIFPAAARSNTPIFYDKGRARTIQEVWNLLNNKVEVARASYVGPMSVETAAPISASDVVSSKPSGTATPVQQQVASVSNNTVGTQVLNAKIRSRQSVSTSEPETPISYDNEPASVVPPSIGFQQPKTYVRSKSGVVYTVPL